MDPHTYYGSQSTPRIVVNLDSRLQSPRGRTEHFLKRRASSPPLAMRPGQPPAKRQKRLDFTSEIQVIVGQEAKMKVFTVPRALLTKSSSYLHSACNDLGGSEDLKLKIPSASPETFEIYLQFVYTSSVVILDEQGEATSVDYFKKLMTGLVQAYVLGDKMEDLTYKNAVMDLMLDEYTRLDSLPNAQEITRAYNATSAGSSLRRALVAMYCYGIELTWLEEHASVLPPLFLTDIVGAFARAHDGGVKLVCPGQMPRCMFHEHSEVVPVCE